MMRNVWKPIVALLVLVASIVLLAYIKVARAEGAPTASALAYSGTLLYDGEPVTGSKEIGATLWSSADGQDPADTKCTVPSQPLALDNSGRFRLPLGGDCVAAIHSEPELWLGLRVDGAELIPRIKLGAVPYSLEATNATRVTLVSKEPANARKLTLHGRYCGATDPVDGALNTSGSSAGFVTAKTLCEQACQEGSKPSPTAHVCLAEELVRLRQLGEQLPATAGWIATGLAAMGSEGAQCTANDCKGFTNNGEAGGTGLPSCGSIWTGQDVTTQYCNLTAPLLCCD